VVEQRTTQHSVVGGQMAMAMAIIGGLGGNILPTSIGCWWLGAGRWWAELFQISISKGVAEHRVRVRSSGRDFLPEQS
jgi:hypothetical protein